VFCVLTDRTHSLFVDSACGDRMDGWCFGSREESKLMDRCKRTVLLLLL
jgi:hypothetical protein